MEYRRKYFKIITAISENNAIGFKGKLPWPRNDVDFNHFKKTTMNSVVLVGRNTKLPKLPGRTVIRVGNGKSLNDALDEAFALNLPVFVIGGAILYMTAMDHQYCEQLIISRISGTYAADTFFPPIPSHFMKTKTDGFVEYWDHSPEKPFIDLLSYVFKYGNLTSNRTKEMTMMMPNRTIHYWIRPGDKPNEFRVPFVTSKRLFFRGALAETLWMMQGRTDVKHLNDQQVHIWDENTTEEFLKKNAPLVETGTIGKAYGYQIRKYKQLTYLIKLVKTNITSRRMVMVMWNAADLSEMALPPCHFAYAWTFDGRALHCHVTLRSNDLFHGHPFNVVMPTVMTIMFARMAGVEPGGVLMTMVNAHIYNPHWEKTAIQITNDIHPSPTLVMPKIDTIDDIDKLTTADFKLKNYKHSGLLKAPMVV